VAGIAGPRAGLATVQAVSIAAAVDLVAAQLAAAGLRVAIDVADVNPPCAYVAPPVLTWTFGANQWEADWTVTLVVASTARRVALAELGQLLILAAGALHYVTARPLDLTLPDGGHPLPAYELTWSAIIPPEQT
jgi:hypothetical protein